MFYPRLILIIGMKEKTAAAHFDTHGTSGKHGLHITP
jgi:hypothetical protein